MFFNTAIALLILNIRGCISRTILTTKIKDVGLFSQLESINLSKPRFIYLNKNKKDIGIIVATCLVVY